jgi:hypothetical protein
MHQKDANLQEFISDAEKYRKNIKAGLLEKNPLAELLFRL